MTRRQMIVLLAGASAAAWLAPGKAAAQAYPTRPVTLIIPFPPGGGNDALGRLVADKMSKSIGQQIVVDNRGGAGEPLRRGRLREAPLTVTPSCSPTREHLPSIPASMPILGTIPARILRLSG